MASKQFIVLLVTVCAVSCIDGKQILRSQSCSLGASYWCQSFQTATECGANYHCMQNEWSQNPHGFCGGFLCESCEEVVKEFISTGKLKTVVKNFLDNFCQHDIKDISMPCKYIVDDLLMPFLDNFLKSFTAKKICGLIGICSSVSLTEDHLKKVLAPGIVRNILTPEKIKHIVASKRIEDVEPLDNLDSILAPGAARNIELNHDEGKMHTAKENSLSCMVCSFIISELESVLKNPSVKKDIIGDVDRICKYLPSEMTAECLKYMKEFGPIILQALLQDISPKLICTNYIHACPEVILSSNEIAIPAPTQLSSGVCVFCEIAVQVVEMLLQINKTETELFNWWSNMCNNVLPIQFLQNECNFLLSKVKQMAKMLTSKIAPSNVCQFLYLCKKSEMAPRQLDVCRLGPRLWCSSKTAAKMCKKTAYCYK